MRLPFLRAAPGFSGSGTADRLAWMHRRAAALLVALLVGLAPAAGVASGAEVVRVDFVEKAATDGDLPEGVGVLFRGAHKQTRTSVRTKLPGSFEYPVEIPKSAHLLLGHALSASAFMVESPDLAVPARFRVVFRESGAEDGEHVLLDRTVDLTNVKSDRRWFDERLDLSALAGKKGTMRFEAENLGDAEKAKQVEIFWSSPRIVAAADDVGPNLLFITIDCLRADHLGSHGYERDVSPNLDELAASGVRFSHAYANAPMTLPSIPQIFTSRVFPTRDHDLLTHPIARAGIPNAAFVNNAWIPLWFSQGEHANPPGTFDRLVSGDRNAETITDEALAWLDLHRDGRFALYLHYLDAHTPYRPPQKYVERYADPAYAGPVGDTFNDNEGADTGKYDDQDKKKIVALYDASIRYVDDQVGRLLRALRESGRLDDTLVLISADHGEEFWDHGRFFHGQSLYDELLHVPLLVHLPGGEAAGTVVDRPVRAIDIAPSILEWLSLPRPADFTGGSLAEAIAAPDENGPPLFATATQAQFPTRYAVRTRDRKLIESLDTGTRELFDVGSDPGEKHNVADDEITAAAPLVESLEEARSILRERGYQIEIVGPRSGKADVHVRLEGHPKSGTFLTLDRRREGARPKVSITADGMHLDARAQVDATGSGFRFDRLPDPRNLGTKDLVRVSLEVDGRPVKRDVIALGADGRAPRTDMIDLRNKGLQTEAAPECLVPDEGIRICLWRFPGEKFLAVPEIKDPAVREKLRALGYLQ